MHKFPKKKDCEFFRENARFCNIYWRCVSVQPPPKRNDDRLVACVFPIIIKVYTRVLANIQLVKMSNKISRRFWCHFWRR